jgi:hypothetical protein
MRIKAAINVTVTEDDDQLQALGPVINYVIDDNEDTTAGHKSSVLTFDGGDAEAEYVFTPEVTNGKYLVIVVKEGAVKIRLNGAVTAFGLKVNPAVEVDPLLPYQSDDQPGIFFLGPISATTPLTEMHLENESATEAARVIVALIGEAS